MSDFIFKLAISIKIIYNMVNGGDVFPNVVDRK